MALWLYPLEGKATHLASLQIAKRRVLLTRRHSHEVRIEDDIRKAFAEVRPDLPHLHDMADFQHGTGWGRCQKYIGTDGTRSTSAQAFLRDPSKSHGNIRIITGKTVQKVIFEGDTAVGVEICDTKPLAEDGKPDAEFTERQVVKAIKDVILCAGALGSPAILERSGIGKLEVLRKAEVDVKVDLPGVGEGYQDHPVSSPYNVTFKSEGLLMRLSSFCGDTTARTSMVSTISSEEMKRLLKRRRSNGRKMVRD